MTTALNATLWALLFASVVAMMVGFGLIAYDTRTCGPSNHVAMLLCLTSLVLAGVAGLGNAMLT